MHPFFISFCSLILLGIINHAQAFIPTLNDKISSIRNLLDKLVLNNQLNKQHNLRNINLFNIPFLGHLNKYKERTFEYFFPKFINSICLDFCNNARSFSTRFVKKSAYNNSNLHYITFIRIFDKFNLDYVLKDYYFWKKKIKMQVIISMLESQNSKII
jgi:hypothetical protein